MVRRHVCRAVQMKVSHMEMHKAGGWVRGARGSRRRRIWKKRRG